MLPALSAFAAELNKNGVAATVTNHSGADGSIALTTGAEDESGFVYAVKLAPQGVDASPDTSGDDVALPVEGSTSVTEVHLASGSAGYCLWGLTETQVIADVLAQFEQHRRT